jgi:hypothetical protein
MSTLQANTGSAVFAALQLPQAADALSSQKDLLNDLTGTTLSSFKSIIISWGVSYVLGNVVDSLIKIPSLVDAYNQTMYKINNPESSNSVSLDADRSVSKYAKQRKVVVYDSK